MKAIPWSWSMCIFSKGFAHQLPPVATMTKLTRSSSWPSSVSTRRRQAPPTGSRDVTAQPLRTWVRGWSRGGPCWGTPKRGKTWENPLWMEVLMERHGTKWWSSIAMFDYQVLPGTFPEEFLVTNLAHLKGGWYSNSLVGQTFLGLLGNSLSE